MFTYPLAHLRDWDSPWGSLLALVPGNGLNVGRGSEVWLVGCREKGIGSLDHRVFSPNLGFFIQRMGLVVVPLGM
jgi:hypothetical protein